MTPTADDSTLNRVMKIRAASQRRIPAPANRVYGYLADFVEHHPQILPEEFGELVVEHGGYGAGTVATFELDVAGRVRQARIRVDEPEPGRVLTETDLDTGVVTTFTVDAAPRASSTVRIETTWEAHGPRALVERIMAPRLLGDLYARELERLDLHARREMRLSPRIFSASRSLVFGAV